MLSHFIFINIQSTAAVHNVFGHSRHMYFIEIILTTEELPNDEAGTSHRTTESNTPMIRHTRDGQNEGSLKFNCDIYGTQFLNILNI